MFLLNRPILSLAVGNLLHSDLKNDSEIFYVSEMQTFKFVIIWMDRGRISVAFDSIKRYQNFYKILSKASIFVLI